MKLVFADTFFWVASLSPCDPWHESVVRVYDSLVSSQIVTTQEVLTEFLSMYAGRGKYLRGNAIKLVQLLLKNSHVTVVQQSNESFLDGCKMYLTRTDKAYSLVDCISMQTMWRFGIDGVLTNDHHFAQEGFNVLIARQNG